MKHSGETNIGERESMSRRVMREPYADPDRPGVWRVPLVGYLCYREALIDEADLSVVRGKKWNWREHSDKTGGIVILARPQKPLHRLILGVTDRAVRVSFVNGDTLDCRRQNLIARTQTQVLAAARPHKTRDGIAPTSSFKGVGFDKKGGKWRACIRRDGLQTTIGMFDDESAAAEAFDDCARVWFGEHAYLNFPDRELTEQNRVRAQAVLDKAIRRQRRTARFSRKLKRLLKRIANEGNPTIPAPTPETPTINSKTARKLLNVPRMTWRKWEKRGWLSCARIVDGRRKYPIAAIKTLLEACGRLRPAYPDPQRPNVWRVPLVGRPLHRKEVLIDASSLPLITDGWCSISGRKTQTGEEAYVSLWSPALKQQRPLHRVIAGITDDDLQVGHRNDDALDCRSENLTVVNAAQRSYRNRKIASINGQPTSSQFKGVSWSKRGKKWMAMIHTGGTARYLGLYKNEHEAAAAYDNAARESFGEHARLNFPDGVDAWLERQFEEPNTPERAAA